MRSLARTHEGSWVIGYYALCLSRLTSHLSLLTDSRMSGSSLLPAVFFVSFVPFRGYCLLSLRAYSRSHFERVQQEAGSTLSAVFNVSIRSVITPDCR